MSININNYDETIQGCYEAILFFPAYARENRSYQYYNTESDAVVQNIHEGYIHVYVFSWLPILDILFSAKKDEESFSLIKNQESLFFLKDVIYN